MLIKDKDRETLKAHFAETLEHPVTVVLYTLKEDSDPAPKEMTCAFCRETEALLQELAGLSDKVTLEVRDFAAESAQARAQGVDKVPGILLVGAKDYGVRYFGAPVGYEFTTIVEDMVDVSRGATSLAPGTKARLAKVDKDIHLQVFVTPNCPYCPKAVRLAHQMAVESDHIRADMIESSEFPDLVEKYNVFGVPRIIVNEGEGFEGAMPESVFLLSVLQDAGQLTDEEKALIEKAREEHAKHAHDSGHDQGPEHDHEDGHDHGTKEDPSHDG